MQFAITLLFAVLLTFTADNVSARPSKLLEPAAKIDLTNTHILSDRVDNKNKLRYTHVRVPQNQRLNRRAASAKDTLQIMDMTPAEATRNMCFPSALIVPNAEDCQTIVDAQLYASTGSLVADPDTLVYVSSGSCAVVFQNLDDENPQTQFNWAMLGKVAKGLFNKCIAGNSMNMGGAIIFGSYLNVTLSGVFITLQPFDGASVDAAKAGGNSSHTGH